MRLGVDLICHRTTLSFSGFQSGIRDGALGPSALHKRTFMGSEFLIDSQFERFDSRKGRASFVMRSQPASHGPPLAARHTLRAKSVLSTRGVRKRFRASGLSGPA